MFYVFFVYDWMIECVLQTIIFFFLLLLRIFFFDVWYEILNISFFFFFYFFIIWIFVCFVVLWVIVISHCYYSHIKIKHFHTFIQRRLQISNKILSVFYLFICFTLEHVISYKRENTKTQWNTVRVRDIVDLQVCKNWLWNNVNRNFGLELLNENSLVKLNKMS